MHAISVRVTSGDSPFLGFHSCSQALGRRLLLSSLFFIWDSLSLGGLFLGGSLSLGSLFGGNSLRLGSLFFGCSLGSLFPQSPSPFLGGEVVQVAVAVSSAVLAAGVQHHFCQPRQHQCQLRFAAALHRQCNRSRQHREQLQHLLLCRSSRSRSRSRSRSSSRHYRRP